MEVVNLGLLSYILNCSLTQWLVTFLIGILTYTVVSLFIQHRKLPPGPLPLPIVGNMLSFVGKTPILTILDNYRRIYGDVTTIWFGNKAHVLVSNWNLIKDALINKRDDFSGRPDFIISRIVLERSHDIILTDISPVQIALKKIGANAVKKYITTPSFVEITYDKAINFVDKIIKKEEPFDPADYIYEMLCSIMEIVIFGEESEDNDMFKEPMKTFEEEMGNGHPGDFVPILRPFFRYKERSIKELVNKCSVRIKEQLKKHNETINKDDVKDLLDALLVSRNEEKIDKQLLTDDNLHFVILDFFMASLGTTHQVLTWLILYLANDMELQNRLYKEITNNIGNRMVVPDDKEKCPLISASISETMRIKTPVPLILPHKTTCATTIAKIRGRNHIFSNQKDL